MDSAGALFRRLVSAWTPASEPASSAAPAREQPQLGALWARLVFRSLLPQAAWHERVF